MPASLLNRAALGVSVVVGLYAAFVGLLLTPSVQRSALYANRINTLFLDNLYDPRKFGFAKNQVSPFNIRTPDGEKLFVWHVLPVDVYTRHEHELRSQDAPEVHGNAGHLAQGHRPFLLRQLSALPNTHILSLDYRGFGHSTGSPTESGLITDGTALLHWVLHVAGIPPENIIVLGQSLGTAVASGIALRFASPSHELIPPQARETHLLVGTPEGKAPTVFAGIVLIAPFSSLPSLLLTYRFGGLFPLMLPIKLLSLSLAERMAATVADRWPNAERLAAYVRELRGSPKISGPDGRALGRLQLVHALNDYDISFRQTEFICAKVHEGSEDEVGRCVGGIEGPRVVEFENTGSVQERYEILVSGGHNRIQVYSPVMAAVIRAFGVA